MTTTNKHYLAGFYAVRKDIKAWASKQRVTSLTWITHRVMTTAFHQWMHTSMPKAV